jgi:hypothetical protein
VIDPVDTVKVAEDNPNSRFKVLDNPILPPGTCIMCKSAGGDGRQFIDLGITVDWFGCIYFCTYCISEAGKLIGLAPKSDWALAEKNLQKEISKLDDLYVNAKVSLDAARLLLRNCDCESRVTSPPDSDSVEADSEPESDDSDSDESGSVEGIDDVPESASYDELVAAVSKRKPRGTRKSAE